tara:strand:+ start:81 stop:287 length:207 start_codon:yes stop_codon:yes gene_type:complete
MAKKESFLSKLRKDSSLVQDELENMKKELMELRFSLTGGQLKETHKIKEIKKSIARLKTIKRENRDDN